MIRTQQQQDEGASPGWLQAQTRWFLEHSSSSSGSSTSAVPLQLFCTMASMLHRRDTRNGCVLACTRARTLPPLDHAPIRQPTPYDGPDTHWELLSHL